jgi:hypothetical protein
MFTRTILAVLLMGTLACSDPRPQQTKESEAPEPPKALQDHSKEYSLKSSRSSNDLVEELYAELLEKDTSLKKMEDKLKNLQQSESDSTESFTLFNEKNTRYHDASSPYLSRINDSLLRERIKQLLSNSLANYKNSTAVHQQLLRRIEINKTSLNDLHIAVQLVSTLSMMEKYRKENMPDKLSLAGFILEQQKARKMVEQQLK